MFPFEIIGIGEWNPELRIRGALPLNGQLEATLNFGKDTYQPGEIAHLDVTLTNHSDTPMYGIVAVCNRTGFDSNLSGTGPGWGLLGSTGV